MKLLLEYRSSSLSKNSRSAPEYEIKVKVQNSDNQHSVKFKRRSFSWYVNSRLGIIITIQMKLLLEARSGHLPKNSRSLPDYEYKSESHNVYLKFRINQHLQGHKMSKVYIEN